MNFLSEIASSKLKLEKSKQINLATTLGQFQGHLCVCNCRPCKRRERKSIITKSFNFPNLMKTINFLRHSQTASTRSIKKNYFKTYQNQIP